MPSFNPSLVVTDVYGEPLAPPPPDNDIKDPTIRAQIVKMEGEIARLSHRDSSREEAALVPEKREALRQFILANQPKQTLGSAVLYALANPLRAKFEDPNSIENRSETDKITHMTWCFDIIVAQKKGPDETVTYNRSEMETIRTRVNKAFPHPAVAYWLDKSIRDAEREEERRKELEKEAA